jgi:hypothetical protein
MTEATTRIPWLPSREAAARIARHLGCAPKDAELRIVGKAKAGLIKARGVIEPRPVSLRIVGEGKGGRIKTCGVIETRPVSSLPAAWNGTVDLAGATMKPPEASYEIANLELCYIDLIATGLLPAPAERARWPAAEVVAYLVKGVPLPWAAWQEAGASPAEIEQAKIDLAQASSEGVPAWGLDPLDGMRRRIPSDDFRDEKIKKKVVPVSVAHPPKVAVDCQGSITTSPRSSSIALVIAIARAARILPALLLARRSTPPSSDVRSATRIGGGYPNKHTHSFWKPPPGLVRRACRSFSETAP